MIFSLSLGVCPIASITGREKDRKREKKKNIPLTISISKA